MTYRDSLSPEQQKRYDLLHPHVVEGRLHIETFYDMVDGRKLMPEEQRRFDLLYARTTGGRLHRWKADWQLFVDDVLAGAGLPAIAWMYVIARIATILGVAWFIAMIVYIMWSYS